MPSPPKVDDDLAAGTPALAHVVANTNGTSSDVASVTEDSSCKMEDNTSSAISPDKKHQNQTLPVTTSDLARMFAKLMARQANMVTTMSENQQYNKTALEEMAQTISDVEQRLARAEEMARTIGDLEQRLARIEVCLQPRPTSASVCVEDSGQTGQGLELSPLADAQEHLVDGSSHGARASPTVIYDKLKKQTGEGDIGAVYTMSISMWDAAMLVGFCHVRTFDKLILFTGVVLNLALQAVLLAVVSYNMLTSDYTEDSVNELIRWRIEKGHGHDQVDPISGQTLVQRLCSQELWSYEQDQYNIMHAYLYNKMPGWSLAILAITLWILTVAVEFRGVCEQAVAVLQMRRARGGESGLVAEEDGLAVLGMQNSKKVFIFITLIMPRMFSTCVLAVVGCRYLAQTVSLGDLVLNSMALAFVMEVDELVAEVLLSRELRAMVQQVKPIKVGKPCKIGSLHVSDLVRYGVTAGTIIYAYIFWLRPYSTNVEASAMALCGGELGFSQMGGTPNLSTVVLLNNSDFVSDCSTGKTFQDYLSNYYGINVSVIVPRSNPSYQQLAESRLKETLAFAYQDCPAGEILSCPAQEEHRKCTVMNRALQNVLKSLNVEVGSNHALPPTCPHFDPELTCNSTVLPKSCAWSWQAYKCEHSQPPPGYLQQTACATDLGKRDVLYDSCHTWEGLFNTPHPSANCDIANKCSTSTNCLTMAGHLELTVGNDTAFLANAAAVEVAVVNGLNRSLDVSRRAVTILQVSGGPYNWMNVKDAIDTGLKDPGRRLQAVMGNDLEPWEYDAKLQANDIVVINNTFQVKFMVSALPVSLLPSSIPERAAALLAQMNLELGSNALSRSEFKVRYDANTNIVQALKKVLRSRTDECTSLSHACKENGDACGECKSLSCDKKFGLKCTKDRGSILSGLW